MNTANLTFTNSTTARIGTGGRTFQIDDAETEFDMASSGSGSITKTGAGLMLPRGVSTYTNGTNGATFVNAGTLLVNGGVASASTSGTGSGAVKVNSSGSLLGGTGAISVAVTVGTTGPAITAGTRGTGGTVAAADVGTLSTGALTPDQSGVFHADILNAAGTAGTSFDRVAVTGTLTLAGTLELNIASGLTFGANDKLVLITNDGTDAISGTFAGLAEGGAITTNGYTFYADYFGGDGNDFALTATPVPEPSTWEAGFLTLGVLAYSQRRRFRARAVAKA